MNAETLKNTFETFDLQGLQLDRDDALLLLAYMPESRWEHFFQCLKRLNSRKREFLEDSERPERLLAFAADLLDLIYPDPDLSGRFLSRLTEFLSDELTPFEGFDCERRAIPEYFRNEVIYAFYADKMAQDFDGMTTRLDYLAALGVTVLWILPFLDSPGDDAGYDQRDRTRVAAGLGGNPAFARFLDAARRRNMTVMMDLVINHRSWETMRPEGSQPAKYQRPDDYFVFQDGSPDRVPEGYRGESAFEGMEAPASGAEVLSTAGQIIRGTWTYHREKKRWFYHTFLPQQPDVNWENPEVLIDDLRTLALWMDGGDMAYVRLDAIPYLYKRPRALMNAGVLAAFPEISEIFDYYRGRELPQVHLMVRLIGAFLTHRYGLSVGILTESNSTVERWRKYFGEGAGAKLNYQFYRSQALWASLARGDRTPLRRALSATPVNVPGCAGVMFARVHDELTFAHVEAEVTARALRQLLARMKDLPPQREDAAERAAFDEIKSRLPSDANVYEFCGRGIAARVSSVLRAIPRDPQSASEEDDLVAKHGLLMSLIVSLDDIPLIYMGDEWGEPDNWQALLETSPGLNSGLDMRNVHRAIDDFSIFDQLLQGNAPSAAQRMFDQTRRLLAARRANPAMTHGSMTLLAAPEGDESILTFLRTLGSRRVLVASNLGLTAKTVEVSLEQPAGVEMLNDLLDGARVAVRRLPQAIQVRLSARQTRWIELA